MRRYEVEVIEFGKTKERKLFNNQVDAFKYANSLEQRTGVKIAELDGESYIPIAEREEERHVDHLIRHKWPEEKPTYDPDNPKQYLVLDCTFEKASYHPDGYFWTFECGQEYILEDVSYWWNLPEVE